MSSRPTPRRRVPLGALAAAAILGGCRAVDRAPGPTGCCVARPDSTVATTPMTPATPEPPAPLALSLIDVFPRTDTLTRVGIDIVTGVRGARNWSAVVVVDSGTAAERRLQLLGADIGYASDTVWGAGFVPGAGRHRFTVIVTDFAKRTASLSFEREFVLDDVPYTVTPLPDLGFGADATTITESGVVTGWVLTADGRRKPALWRGGALQLVPAPDTIDVIARGTNAAGDVLLQYDSVRAGGRAARVRRADGTELLVGNGVTCCATATELTESRLALGHSAAVAFPPNAAILDVASGTVTDVTGMRTLVLNDVGHSAGVMVGGYMMVGRYLQTVGFTAPPVPKAYTVTICDRPQRFSRLVPLALDDAANLLADYCGNLVTLPQSGPSEFVDRHLGRTTAVRLSRRGGVLASFDPSSGLLLWRLGSERTARVVTAGAWRVDGLAGVNGAGAIAAFGVDASGRRAALLLTPR